jgi:hypothetical protein
MLDYGDSDKTSSLLQYQIIQAATSSYDINTQGYIISLAVIQVTPL